MAKKTVKTPPADPKEKAVFLRVMPEDYAIMEEMKKTFYQATINQAVIKGLHDWKALIMEVNDLKQKILDVKADRDMYYKVIKETAEGLMASQALITSYKNIIKGQDNGRA